MQFVKRRQDSALIFSHRQPNKTGVMEESGERERGGREGRVGEVRVKKKKKKMSHVGRRKGETAERFLRCVFGSDRTFILAEVR